MIVPGHVVFLWRIIHQHFTLAFLEHISTCRWSKPSWPLEKVAFLPFYPPPKKLKTNPCLSVFWRDRSDAPLKRAPLFWVISAAANPGGFHWKQLIHSERCQELEGSSFLFFLFFLMTRTISSVFGVWLVRFYAGSTTWTSNRRSSHIPPAPVPWSCHGRRRKGSCVSSLSNATELRIHAK